MKRTIAIALAASLAACAHSQPPATASGKPDVTIAGGDLECMKDMLADSAANRGWRITPSEPRMLIVETEAAPGLAATLLSTMAGPPRLRVQFTFLRQGRSVRVVSDAFTITGSGGYEQVRTRSMTSADQSTMEEFQRAAVEHCAR